MIHPSYTELMAVINSEVEEGEQPLVQSRYSIVKATANRAKEIIDAKTSHYQSQLKNSTKVRLRFLEVQTRILHYN